MLACAGVRPRERFAPDQDAICWVAMLAHPSPDPADDTDVLRSPWDITPTLEETTRLWRLAGARREEESPGTVLAAAVALLPRQGSLHRALVRVLNRVQLTPTVGNGGLPDDLFSMALAYQERLARRMLNAIERDLV